MNVTLRRHFGWPAVAVWLVVAALRAGDASIADRFTDVPPIIPATIHARAHQVALDGFNLSESGGTEDLRAGDTITALVTLYRDKWPRQWLLQLTTRELTAAETKANAPRPMTMFTTTGDTLDVMGYDLGLSLRTIGPFRDDRPLARPKDKRVTHVVNSGFLRLAFAGGCEATLKMQQAHPPGAPWTQPDFALSYFAFPEERMTAARASVEKFRLTPDEVRGLAALAPAVAEFFNVAYKTPELDDILAELLDKGPLAWSMIRRGGKLTPRFEFDYAGIAPVDIAPWFPELANGTRAFEIPFTVYLNERPSLLCRMVVTSPRPPLLTTAGAVLLTVQHHKDKTRHAVIRVLSAKLGPEAQEPAMKIEK